MCSMHIKMLFTIQVITKLFSLHTLEVLHVPQMLQILKNVPLYLESVNLTEQAKQENEIKSGTQLLES